MSQLEIRRVTLPAAGAEDREALREARALWRVCFGAELETELRPQIAGEEVDVNEDVVYLGFGGGRLAATCHLTRCRKIRWAGLGEVATVPEFRGRGLAQTLCRTALEDFEAGGGEAIWLGTVNPAAASVYARLGFGYLPDTSVMQRLSAGRSPTAFAKDWTAPEGLRIVPGSPAFRIPLIPLLTAKLGLERLDDNAGLVGTEFRPQHSCMGLYPKYAEIIAKGGGWHALTNGVGAVLGLSSWLPNADGTRRVSGFCHPKAKDWTKKLLEVCRSC